MTKASGTWTSLLQGVSQRPDELRDHQHHEQVNCLVDPVAGLVRRPGTMNLQEFAMPSLNGTAPEALGQYRYYAWQRPEKPLVHVLYRTGPGAGPALWTWDGAVARPYRLAKRVDPTAPGPAGDNPADYIDSNGVASVTGVGGYLAIVVANNPVGYQPTAYGSWEWGTTFPLTWEYSRRIAEISFRSLAPQTDYQFKVEFLDADDNVLATFGTQYSTPPAAFPGRISTEGVAQYVGDGTGDVWSQEVADPREGALGGRCAVHTLAKGQFLPRVPVSAPGVSAGNELGLTGWTNVWPARPVGAHEYAIEVDGSLVTHWKLGRYLYLPEAWIDKAGDAASWFLFNYQHDPVIPNPLYSQAVQRIQQRYNEDALEYQSALIKALSPSTAAQFAATWLGAQPGFSTWGATNTDAASGGVVPIVAVSTDPTVHVRVTLLPAVASGYASGDNSHVKITSGGEVAATTDLPPRAYPGQTVRVRPAGGTASYYLTARTTVTVSVAAWRQDVTWTEGSANDEFPSLLCFGTMTTDPDYSVAGAAPGTAANHLLVGTAHPAPRATQLRFFAPRRRDLAMQVAKDAGVYMAYAMGVADLEPYGPARTAGRKAGDKETNPDPAFVGRVVDHITTYQGRLVVCSAGELSLSAVGDYNNFYRSTVITVREDDAIARLASRQAGDDRIVESAAAPVGLALAGQRALYLLPGDAPVSLLTSRLLTYSAQSDTQGLAPHSGELMCVTASPAGCGVISARPSNNGLTAWTQDESAEVLSYLRGDFRGALVLPRPSTLVLRTTAPSTLYVLSFATANGERTQRAWHRWSFAPQAGELQGHGSAPQGRSLLLFFMRKNEAGTWHLAVDNLQLDPRVAPLPYLDAQRPVSRLGAGAIRADDVQPKYVAFSEGLRRYVGAPLSGLAGLLSAYPDGLSPVVGLPFESSVTLTSPHIRNRDGAREPRGSLAVRFVEAQITESSGLVYDLAGIQPKGPVELTARLTGSPGNDVGTEPVRSYKQRITVGRRREDYTLTLRSRDWRPWGITALAWSGESLRRYL